MPTLTPMLRQYREVKNRLADALVLYRLGDFYELFEQDAELAARQLGLVLTSRRFSKDVRLPMCGIPHHRLNTYVARLIQHGHKVAIVEQMEDPRQAKRLVHRDVVRVVTPGTIVEDALLREREENLLVSVLHGSGRQRDSRGYGLAVVDLSTGEFATTQIDGPDAEQTFWEELARLAPSEVVLPRQLAADQPFIDRLQTLDPARISPFDDEAFVPAIATERLETHLGVASLEGFGCDEQPLAVGAAGGVLGYLQANQISDLAHIVRLITYDLTAYVGLDAITRNNLELVRTLRQGRQKGSLYDTLDRTLTAMGGRMLRRWLLQPLLDLPAIHTRQETIQELVDKPLLRADLREMLDGLYDVERLVGRIGFGSANARDMVALRQALERIPAIQKLLLDTQAERLHQLNELLDTDVLAKAADLIARAITDDPPILLREGGLIRAGYDGELENLRQIAGHGRDWLAELEAEERERTGIKNLRIRYNQVFGFFIEVTRSNLERVPADYERRATVRHAERFVTPRLKTREAEILSAEEQIQMREYDLFVEVRDQVAAKSDVLTRAARVLAELDTLAALAEVAATNRYVRPVVDESGEIDVRAGRHPVVEHSLPDGERFVPNDTRLVDEEQFMILTGPNMSGKSVYIRQVALIVLLAQIGSFVPADEARIGLVDRIFVRAGASDDITQGRSTFLVEMSETGYILHHATAHSLVVLDEVGRGTSTYDGMSIAWAVAEELHDRIGARTLFATHFHELTRLTAHLAAARNYTLAVSERGQQVIFMRQLIAGGADKSYGIQVARLAGLPERVVCRARVILSELECQEPGAQIGAVVRESQSEWPGDDNLPVPLQGVDERAIWAVLCELAQIDVANTTPVQALVALNELQNKLARE